MLLQQFRKTVYQCLRKRADTFLDLLDALTTAGHVNSPVALSEETPYRRKFSSVFDTLRQAEFDFDELLPALYEFQPPDSGKIAGYEVYGLDSTPNERPEAETLEDRGSLKTQKDDPVRYGHKYSWLTRLIQWGTSWVAPVATGAVGGMISGQASRATAIVLTGQDIGNGLGNPTDMLVDGALGGIASYVGYEAGRLISSTGPYGSTGGHHIHAKAAFEGNPAYGADDAISVSNQYMRSKGWSHPQMTGTQHTLFNNLASSGSLNTMSVHNQIAYGSLRAGGASPIASWYLVQRSGYNLAKQGVTNPT